MGKFLKTLFTVTALTVILLNVTAGSNVNIYYADRWLRLEAEKLMAEMSLEQKIGQMVMVSLSGSAVAADGGLTSACAAVLRDSGAGGVILFAGNCGSTKATALLTSSIKRETAGYGRVPPFIGIDQEGGIVTRLETGTSMPGNMALAATGDPKYAYLSAEVIGNELAATGIDMDFAPDTDVNCEPRNPVIGVRSFSDDPETVAEFAGAFIDGLHSQGIMATVKHFPGHGDTATDSHTGLPMVDKSIDELLQTELLPFAAVADRADVVMTAHIQFPQVDTGTYRSVSSGDDIHIPATLSRTVITGILRERLGFKGVVSTDSMVMDAITKNFGAMEAAKMAINAGADLLLMPVELSGWKPDALPNYISGIAAMVRDGSIDEDTVDEAVIRILKLKLRYGMMEAETPDAEEAVRRARASVGSEEHHETEWEITLKSVTMLKNDGAIPEEPEKLGTVLMICPYESEERSLQYALNRLKSDGVLRPDCEAIIDHWDGRSASYFSDSIRRADCVVFAVETTNTGSLASGSKAVSFGNGIISAAHEQGKKVTFISLQLPYDAAAFSGADGVLLVYNYCEMPVMPDVFNGETVKYGPSMPAGFYAALGGGCISGKLPVDIPGLGGSEEIIYARGSGLQLTF